MSNLNFIFCILLFSISINQILTAETPENFFTPLNSREVTPFQLTKKVSELYFSFENQFEDSDIIINLKVAKGFTTYCYIYDSYDNIQTDEMGEYTGFLKSFVMTEKYVLLASSEYRIKKAKYYIIIKDIINSFNRDYLSIFNEQDTIALQNEKYITFDRFYSKNKFYLSFSLSKTEMASLELNIDNSLFSQYVSVYFGEAYELVYVGEKNRGEIKLNEDLQKQGTYLVEIESEEVPYQDISSSIILHIYERNVKELKFNNPMIISFTKSKNYGFYVDLSEYDYEEENIITFKFGSQIFDRNLLSHCYAKAMNFEVNDDNKFLANIPANEDENEARFVRLSGTTDIYQLYFKNTQKREENKKTYLLIHLSLQVEEHDAEEYISPDEFTIYLSNKPEIINLSKFKNSHDILNKNIQLQNYVPQVYKVVLPKEEERIVKLSYLFYTSNNIQIVYNNTMLGIDNQSNEKPKMLYAISPRTEGYDYTKCIYLKLYGYYENPINFRIESNEAMIYYIDKDIREIKTISDKLSDCSQPFYYIGDYGLLVEKGYIYQENLYGKINTYYKGKINSEDQSILINEDSKYLVQNNLFSLDTSIDIVELKCEFPGFYQVHLMDDANTRDINLYSKIYNYLPANKNITISPNLSPIQKDINLEISTLMGKEIKINYGDKTITLDSNNKYYQINYENSSEVPESFIIMSSENTVVSISLTNKEAFQIVDSESAHIGYDNQILVKLNQNKDYRSVNVAVTRIYHGYRYSIYRGNINYAPKLVESQTDYITIDRSHKINMTLTNPYLRDQNNNINDENNVYYIIFSIDDPEKIEKDVIITYNEIEEYEIINIGKPKILFNENEKYTLPKSQKVLNIIYQSCDNSLQTINIYYYEDKIQDIKNKESKPVYQYDKILNNSFNSMDIDISLKDTSKDNPPFLNGAVIGFTEEEITDEKIQKYSELKLNICQKGEKVEWEKIENVENYDVYILNENNTYAQYLNNPCLLQSIKNNVTLNSKNVNEDNYVKYISTNESSITMKEKGKYAITVSANIEGEVPLVYIYDKIIYDSSENDGSDDNSDEDDDKDDKGTIIFLAIALPIVIIIVLVLLFVLIKSKKPNTIDIDDAENDKLVRDTNQSIE